MYIYTHTHTFVLGMGVLPMWLRSLDYHQTSKHSMPLLPNHKTSLSIQDLGLLGKLPIRKGARSSFYYVFSRGIDEVG